MYMHVGQHTHMQSASGGATESARWESRSGEGVSLSSKSPSDLGAYPNCMHILYFLDRWRVWGGESVSRFCVFFLDIYLYY